jgi:eukaryotic-like serine/threonine-protein kinase
LPLPSQIGRYRVERELGRGAMGVIYQAHDPDIDRKVAIKLVRADLLASEDRDDYLARFRHEAQAAGRCMHPNIVAIYDFALHDGNPFLAMEYVDGIALGQALQRVGRFPPAEAVAIILQVLAALGAAHALGIVHRDVKPANILLLPGGQVKVTDFGISRINTSDMTQDGTVIGTPSYMSPEQCRGEVVDLRSDLFSTGAILYELLSGTRPFPGRNAAEVTHNLLTSEPPDLAETVPGIPDTVIAVVRRAMQKPREARFASAQEMADALRQATHGVTRVAATTDATVVLPRPQTTFDDATLATVERRLAEQVGPIARHLVRAAARQTSSVEALYESVAQNIQPPAERAKFLAEALGGSVLRSTTTTARSTIQRPAAPTVTMSAEQIDRVERALTQHLGPIARLLIKRTLPSVGSEVELWQALATHIERPADREAFLRQRSSK